MLRYRRYRAFIVFALLAIIGFYHFGSRAQSVDYLKEQLNFRNTKQQSSAQDILKNQRPVPPSSQQRPGEPKHDAPHVVAPGKAEDVKVTPPAVEEPRKPVQYAPPPPKSPNTKLGSPSEPKKEQVITDKTDAKEKDDEVKDGRVRMQPNPVPANSWEEKVKPMMDLGEGRHDSDQSPLAVPPIYWEKPAEHFPLADKSVIQLPTGKPKKLPKVQASFEAETAEKKKDRLAKQGVIKEAFLHAWKGYRKNAWGHDEVKPVSGTYKDPFNGWGATLVDSLDLIWMMGLKDEFEEAVAEVGKINFKTSPRADIPLFETTIRYLGGLLGAYDVSGGKYRVLLDKAVELAEVLIGAFDTPNRMPDTFYQWKPAFASNTHRAGSRVVLAELGSLALEFTRLAQLTKEPRYYDAIARITDALEEWQDRTRLPGMWPSLVDASGCNKTYPPAPALEQIQASGVKLYDAKGNLISSTTKSSEKAASDLVYEKDDDDHLAGTGIKKGKITKLDEHDVPIKDASTPAEYSDSSELEYIPLKKPDPLVFNVKEGEASRKTKRQLHDPAAKLAAEAGPSDGLSSHKEVQKTSVDLDDSVAVEAKTNYNVNSIPGQVPTHKHDSDTPYINVPDYTSPICTPQNLESQSKWGSDAFTLGSLADSTYEYLPKMFLMLHGLGGQYRTMYEKAIDTAKEKLLFRVMLPDEKREVLVSGELTVQNNPDENGNPEFSEHFKSSGSHLTCFVGGMFGLGAKLFDRKEDLEIAKKLTDGCVWAYESTATGIMPETFSAVACNDRRACAWNESKWWEELDPHPEWREQNYEANLRYYEAQVRARENQRAMAEGGKKQPVVNDELMAEKIYLHDSDSDTDNLKSSSDLVKRQLDADDLDNVVTTTAKKDTNKDSAHELTSDKFKSAVKDEDYWNKAAEAPDNAEDAQVAKQAAIKQHHLEHAKENHEATATTNIPESEWEPPTTTEEDIYPPIYSPDKPLTHKEFVTNKIKEDRLPEGYSVIMDRRYILRPEALESVFYMHRLTGSPYWRTAGWNMISAVLKHTRTLHAHSAIDDVTKTVPTHTDSMESFWLAETLKYAWLLFEEEDKWSLDEWVLNTEAHPLKVDKS